MSLGRWSTITRVSGSSSLNGAAWGIVAPKHMPTFVAALLSEYFFVLDVLEFYPTQNDAPLLESAIRMEIRVDLHRHFECPKSMFLIRSVGGSTSVRIEVWKIIDVTTLGSGTSPQIDARATHT